MSSLGIASIAFACVFGSAILGLFLRAVLPENHLKDESKDIVKLGAGVVATMAALVLGMLTSTAKSSFDRTNDELMLVASKMILFDRVLAQYGPETKEIRDAAGRSYKATIELLLSDDRSKIAKLDSPEAVTRAEDFQVRLRALSPQNEAQRVLQSRALDVASDLNATRWLLLLQSQGEVSVLLLVTMVFWFAMVFTTFGVFAPRNLTVITVLFLFALSVSAAIFLILEMERPFEGVIKISSAPLLKALAHLGQ